VTIDEVMASFKYQSSCCQYTAAAAPSARSSRW